MFLKLEERKKKIREREEFVYLNIKGKIVIISINLLIK